MIKFTAIVILLLLTVIPAGAMEHQGPKVFRTPHTAFSRSTKQHIALAALATTSFIVQTQATDETSNLPGSEKINNDLTFMQQASNILFVTAVGACCTIVCTTPCDECDKKSSPWRKK